MTSFSECFSLCQKRMRDHKKCFGETPLYVGAATALTYIQRERGLIKPDWQKQTKMEVLIQSLSKIHSALDIYKMGAFTQDRQH